MFNRNHTSLLREVNELFGWDVDALVVEVKDSITPGYSENEWWRKISDGNTPFMARSSKASEIQHAALRYFHRLLVFALFSREDLGKLTKEEIHFLWRASDGNYDLDDDDDNNEPLPKVNFGHFLLQRFNDLRNDPKMKGPIHIGGMITWLAYKLGYGDDLAKLEPLEEMPLLNLRRLKIIGMIEQSRGNPNKPYVWFVKDVPWCYLPSEFMSEAGDAENQWRVPREVLDHRDRKSRRRARMDEEHQEVDEQQHLGQQHQPMESQRRSYHAGSSSHDPHPSQEGGNLSSPSFDIANAFARLSMQIGEVSHREPIPSIYESNIYDYHVNEGHFAPPVNYPYHPPQHGPVPCYEEERIDDAGNPLPRTTLTYPYWQGPGTQYNRPYTYPPYDYRAPGGCDYLGDPAYPWVNPEPPQVQAPLPDWQLDLYRNHGFPPGFSGGWDPHGPPFPLSYEWHPRDPAPPRED